MKWRWDKITESKQRRRRRQLLCFALLARQVRIIVVWVTETTESETENCCGVGGGPFTYEAMTTEACVCCWLGLGPLKWRMKEHIILLCGRRNVGPPLLSELSVVERYAKVYRMHREDHHLMRMTTRNLHWITDWLTDWLSTETRGLPLAV